MAVSAVHAQSVVCLSLKLRARVPFTVGTTVLPSGARGDGSGALCWRGGFQGWVKPTEALGGAKEAHRRWPGGRSEQGREQGKG